MEKAIIQSPLGTTVIYSDEIGVTKIEVVEEALEISHEIPEKLRDAVLQLQEYFEGKRKEFTVPLFSPGSDFQNKVWTALQNIPYGAVRSYKEQSFAIDKPEAIRAVANANGANRISILIPCHRVVGSNGELTGYGGGLWRKKWLLELEKKKAKI